MKLLNTLPSFTFFIIDQLNIPTTTKLVFPNYEMNASIVKKQ